MRKNNQGENNAREIEENKKQKVKKAGNIEQKELKRSSKPNENAQL